MNHLELGEVYFYKSQLNCYDYGEDRKPDAYWKSRLLSEQLLNIDDLHFTKSQIKLKKRVHFSDELKFF